MRAMLRRRLDDLVYPGVVLAIVLVVWEASGRYGYVAGYILPTPTAIAAKLGRSWDLLVHHTWVTTVGIVLAMGVVYVRLFERAFYPWIVATQAIPKVALGPLIVVWFGFGLLPKVVIGCLIAFFPIMIGTIAGLKSIERESLYLLRSMGAGPLKTFWYAQLPNGLPHIFSGMKVAIVLASVGAIVGEFVGANDGLGYVLLTANGMLDTELLFSALVIISVLATVLYWAVHLAERVFIRWHVSVRDDIIATM
jgi:NitT/TauT family transport system permease protein